MKRSKILHLLEADSPQDNVLIKGWVRTRRDASTFSFFELNDGSCLQNMQVIVEHRLPNYDEIKKLSTGAALAVTGTMVLSQGKGQKFEIQAGTVEVVSTAPETYPLQKKRHSDEFLRTIAHLRPRTNKYGAAFRLRSELAFAIHLFFKQRGFVHIHTPIITGSDCEGAGELFRVTTLTQNPPLLDDGRIDFSQDFFGRQANLTVSGQLSAELLALALGDVYTFGPTFRAENSNTRRHASEFWMVEPEMAFCDLQGNMDLAEELLKGLIAHILKHGATDLALFARFVDKGLMDNLEGITSAQFVRLPYREAVAILQQSKKRFEYPVTFGSDLQAEHENFLTDEHCKGPVILFDYPKAIKPFYMRLNDDDETVAAMDVLLPGIGEIVGGSQREERLEVLEARMDRMGLSQSDYWWYLDSRRYGSVPHSGFGLGFERMLMLITGIRNIRDVIPFPRTPSVIDF